MSVWHGNNPNCYGCGRLNSRGFCSMTACIYPCETGMGGYINKPQTNIERNCKNCKFHVIKESMRGKPEGYCVLHKRWRGTTLVCSDFGVADPVHVADVRMTPLTKADKIRQMKDEELARFLLERDLKLLSELEKANVLTRKINRDEEKCLGALLAWLREDAEDVPIEYYENGGK